MQFPSPVSAKWLASFINAEVSGNASGEATGINEIHSVRNGDIVFVDHPKYYDKCINSEATFIIINKKTYVPEGKTLLITSDPFEAYLKIVRYFRPFTAAQKMVSDSAIIGEGTVVMPGAFVGNNVKIGRNCIIHPNVSIYDHCCLGDNVVIQSGTVIGSDAFYYNSKKDREVWYKKMESCGRVLIEDNVEIGASCTIDRGVSGDTIIGKGSKLDNLVHIAHEVKVGANCLIAAQVGIAGSTVLKDGVTIWGQVGVNKTLTIGENAVILAQSGIAGDLEGGKVYWGSPVEDALTKRKELVWVKRIPEIWKRLTDLEEK